MYVKRFLWGVEGVKERGRDVLDELVGGVCDRVGSFMVVECDEGSKIESGDRFGGVCCGIVVSKISERSNVENVRFASSAGHGVSRLLKPVEAPFSLTSLKMKLTMRCSLLLFRGCCR